MNKSFLKSSKSIIIKGLLSLKKYYILVWNQVSKQFSEKTSALIITAVALHLVVQFKHVAPPSPPPDRQAAESLGLLIHHDAGRSLWEFGWWYIPSHIIVLSPSRYIHTSGFALKSDATKKVWIRKGSPFFVRKQGFMGFFCINVVCMYLYQWVSAKGMTYLELCLICSKWNLLQYLLWPLLRIVC